MKSISIFTWGKDYANPTPCPYISRLKKSVVHIRTFLYGPALLFSYGYRILELGYRIFWIMSGRLDRHTIIFCRDMDGSHDGSNVFPYIKIFLKQAYPYLQET